MQHIIKNTIRIIFSDSYKNVFHRNTIKRNTFNKNTSIRIIVKRALSRVWDKRNKDKEDKEIMTE